MKDWLKKNRDTLIITGVAITATAVVAGVTHRIAKNQFGNTLAQVKLQMATIANDAGVLDTIIEHQEKMLSLINE